MTPQELKRIHVALDQCDGNITGAARLLGMSFDRMKRIISENDELKSYLPGATAPSETEAMASRAVVAPTEDELAVATKNSDAQVRKGFDAIGVTGDALTEAMAFRDFGRFHFKDTLHFVGGGVAKLFADLMAEIKVVRKEIETVGPDPEMQKILREDRSRLVGHTIQVYDRVREGSLTAAAIEAKKREADKNKDKPKGKPAFAALAMNVNGNVTVSAPPAASQSPPASTVELASPAP